MQRRQAIPGNQTKIGRISCLPVISDMNWKIAALADFNKDRKLDILWRNETTGDNYVWHMNGVVHTGGDYMPSLASQGWEIAPF
jgi:hypothetical protein